MHSERADQHEICFFEPRRATLRAVDPRTQIVRGALNQRAEGLIRGGGMANYGDVVCKAFELIDGVTGSSFDVRLFVHRQPYSCSQPTRSAKYTRMGVISIAHHWPHHTKTGRVHSMP